MLDGLKSFQRAHGLKVDGVMRPDGPTATRLNAALTEQRGTELPPMSKAAGEFAPDKPPAAIAPGRPLDARPLGLESAEGDNMKRRLSSTEPQGGGQKPMAVADSGRRPDMPFVGKGVVNPSMSKIRPEAEREIENVEANPSKPHDLRFWEAREWAVRNDVHNVHFPIADNPAEKGDAPWYRQHAVGIEAVKKYGAVIDREAKLQGVNHDLIRAIMYVENADGSRGGIEELVTRLGAAKTLMPMNINFKKWQGMGGVKADEFDDPAKNIRAGVALVARIARRVDDPTPEKIGTLWNSMPREKVNSMGARIGRAYRERLWEK